MTPAAVFDRIADVTASSRTGFALAVLRRSFRALGWHYTTAGRCAARYRALTGCTLADAAKAFGLSISTVQAAELKVRQ